MICSALSMIKFKNDILGSETRRWNNQQLILVHYFRKNYDKILNTVQKTWKIHDLSQLSLLKVNHRSTRKMCQICSKLTIKTPERRHFRIRTDYGEIRSISPYSVRMRENDVVLVFYCQLWTYFTHFSKCFYCWLRTSKC